MQFDAVYEYTNIYLALSFYRLHDKYLNNLKKERGIFQTFTAKVY